jgi:hypothetical protein
MTVSAARTYALVVGIEQYATESWPGLNGPVHDACRFVDWLRSPAVNVPAENISLFLSPLGANAGVRPQDPTVAHRPARSALIREEITEKIATLDDADLLFVFWGGHGLGDGENKRHLLFADASPNAPWCFDVESFLHALQSDLYSGIRERVIIIDACATFKEFVDMPATIPKLEFPRGEPRTPEHQLVLYASQQGRLAANLDREQTGLLSKQVLAEISAQPFPPDFHEVAARVAARFKEFDAAGLVQQVPIVFSITDPTGNRRDFHRGTVGVPEAQEWLVPKLYDRDPHESDFVERFEASLSSDAAVHCCLLFGHEYEQHASFAARVIERRVRAAVTRRFEKGRGPCRAVPETIIEERDGVQGAIQEIRQRLGDATGLSMVPKTGWELIVEAGYQRFPVVTFTHLIQVRSSRSSQFDGLRWYLDEFWKPSKDATSPLPKVVLFLLIELAESVTRRSLGNPRSWLADPRESLVRQIRELATTVGGHVLPELTHLSLMDVQNWFLRHAKGRHGLCEDYECRVAAEELFDKADRRKIDNEIRRTDSIEGLLASKFRELIATERVHR